ncbi:MAG: hypothetical protein RIT45_758 [Pseudomonadota bacterium]|jgi:uncharacterized metal-binding protein YceD (DUF177 family)
MSIRIRLEELRDGPRKGEDTLPGSFATERLGRDYSVQTPLRVTWRAQMVHQVVEVQAHVEGELGFGCSRCGDPLRLPVSMDIRHHWVAEGSLEDGEDEAAADNDDPDLSEHDGVSIELDAVLLDAVIVEVPFAPDCTDTVPGRCDNWSDEPIVYHAGSPPPDDDDRHRPFADLLGKITPAAGDETPEA